MLTFEEQKALVARLNLMDDIFFQKVAEDARACEEIIQIILQRPDLKVIEHQVQRSLRNVDAHSVVLDLLCQDEMGNYINIEVQKSDDDDHQRRVRFNHSNIDTMFVEKGLHYDQLPDVYIIFISPFDPFKENKTIYHVNRVIAETGTIVNNGTHEIYVNSYVDDGTDISELMQYFRHTVGDHPAFERLTNQVQYYKESKKGVVYMSGVFQEMYDKGMTDGRTEGRAEGRAENQITTVFALLRKGLSLDFIADIYPNLSRSFLEELRDQYLSGLN